MSVILLSLLCETCRKAFCRERSQQIHRKKRGMRRSFCSRKCAGKARRIGRTDAEKKARKQEYDERYRASNRRRLARNKAAWFRRNYDPIAARETRKKSAKRHAEYIRRYNAEPKHKKEKADYDLTRRASEYGEFAGAYKLLLRLYRYYDQGGRGWQRNELSKSRRAI